MKKFILPVIVGLFLPIGALAHEDHKGHDDDDAAAAVTVKGEIVDMACYLGHGATGADHAKCAKTCIESGLPVGIKTAEGKTYLLIGDHEPINKTLAAYAAKTVTVKGNLSSRDGFNMIENAEIVADSKVIYSCPMHPEVKQNSPGKCPKCGMNLKQSK